MQLWHLIFELIALIGILSNSGLELASEDRMSFTVPPVVTPISQSGRPRQTVPAIREPTYGEPDAVAQPLEQEAQLLDPQISVSGSTGPSEGGRSRKSSVAPLLIIETASIGRRPSRDWQLLSHAK